tara:strand:- start:22 stop:168 length:147 start_codon:yes stop_codon:yes gene_type:complete
MGAVITRHYVCGWLSAASGLDIRDSLKALLTTNRELNDMPMAAAQGGM